MPSTKPTTDPTAGAPQVASEVMEVEIKSLPPANPNGSPGTYAATLFVDLDAHDLVGRYLVRLQHVGCAEECDHEAIGQGVSIEAALFDARFQVQRERS